VYGYRTFAVTVHQPQQEPQHDMAVCHAHVSWTDHKGGSGDVRTGEVQKNRALLRGWGWGWGVNDSKIENMAPRSRGSGRERNKGRKFNIRFDLKRMSPFAATADLTQ
jgi:hypothetical protein